MVKAAQRALESGNVNTILIWAQEKDEGGCIICLVRAKENRIEDHIEFSYRVPGDEAIKPGPI